jgi:DUF1680 family protein
MTTTEHLARSAGRAVSPRRPGRLEPLALHDVALERGFWADRQARNRDHTIPHAERWIHRVGTVENFLPPHERPVPERRGVVFTDSDVYKVLEAMAWERGRAGDPAGDAEGLTATVARSLEPDGYVNTYWGAHGRAERYVELPMGHELYCYVVAACPSCEGTAFFYTKPLHRRTPSVPPSDDHESHHAATAMRAPWFAVPCCPSNVARLIASLGAYVATTDADGVQLHQYAAGTVRAGDVTLSLRTDYPWDGRVEIAVEEAPEAEWTLTLRVPAWAEDATLTVGGRTETVAAGAARVRRAWAPGESVRLDLRMRVRWSAPDPRIDAARGCVAVERAPLVHCAESLGDADLERVAVEPGTARECAVDGLDGLVGLAVGARETAVAERAPWPYGRPPARRGAQQSLTLIPYHAWANRGPSTMRVWLPV